MRKDIEWLKNKVLISKETYMAMRDNSEPHSGSRRFYNGMLNSASLILDFINELDEPEVLSQDWIDEHSVAVAYDGIPDQTEIVYVDELENLIVPKQELPVVPKHVGEWITRYRGKYELYPALRILENNTLVWGEIYEWYRMNTREFVNAFLTGDYKVEEVQKYVIKLPMSTNRDMDFALVDDKGDIWVDAYPSKYKLTEQEILSLPKGDVYFKYFSEPV